MNNVKRTISFLFLVISFTIIVTDCDSFFIMNPGHSVSLDATADFARGVEHSHIHGLEDIFIVNENKITSNGNNLKSSRIPLTNLNIINNYISSIWQPPKNS